MKKYEKTVVHRSQGLGNTVIKKHFLIHNKKGVTNNKRELYHQIDLHIA